MMFCGKHNTKKKGLEGQDSRSYINQMLTATCILQGGVFAQERVKKGVVKRLTVVGEANR